MNDKTEDQTIVADSNENYDATPQQPAAETTAPLPLAMEAPPTCKIALLPPRLQAEINGRIRANQPPESLLIWLNDQLEMLETEKAVESAPAAAKIPNGENSHEHSGAEQRPQAQKTEFRTPPPPAPAPNRHTQCPSRGTGAKQSPQTPRKPKTGSTHRMGHAPSDRRPCL